MSDAQEDLEQEREYRRQVEDDARALRGLVRELYDAEQRKAPTGRIWQDLRELCDLSPGEHTEP